MRSFPVLIAGANRYCLPLADATSAVISHWLLHRDRDPHSDQEAALRAAFEADPSFSLWAVLRASQMGEQVGSARAAATWLLQTWPTVLRWEHEAQQRGADTSRPRLDALRDLYCASLERAWLQPAAATADVIDPEQAYLAGLLHNADGWLDSARQAADQDGEECDQTPEVGFRQAILDLQAAAARFTEGRPAGGKRRQSGAISLSAVRRQVRAAADAWLKFSLASDSLPRLVEKLRRLHELEQRFDEKLEEEKLEAMAEFAAGAGHEINNPLAVISGRAQLFLRGEQDPERRRELALINTQALRVYEMISDMMLFARPPQPEKGEVELASMVEQVLAELEPRARAQAIDLCFMAPGVSVVARGDSTQLAVALRAVVENALEAIGSQGRVDIEIGWVAARAENGSPGPGEVAWKEPETACAAAGGQRCFPEVSITVRDDGPGIPPEVRRHLFDPFYSGRGAGRGLGLGLSKCWRIVTNHGGRVEVSSQVGRGTSLVIWLPQIAAKDLVARD